MNPHRLATVAAWCQTLVLPVCVAACLATFGTAGVGNTRATPMINRIGPSLAANADFTNKTQTVAIAKSQAFAINRPETVAVSRADIAAASEPVKAVAAPALAAAEPLAPKAPPFETRASETTASETTSANTATPSDTTAAADTAQAAHEEKPVVVASLTDSAESLPSETTSSQIATTSPPNAETSEPKAIVGTVDVLDECYVAEACIDRYLWALYQRTPKEDSIKQQDQRQVTVRRRGKLITVTRTFTKQVDEDFAWKDPKAADKAGMTMTDYVIGGMDKDFKQRLFRLLLAAEQAGLSPGITSAFRDDYRQSIAAGLKAASDRSFHGGSFRGGYGHGLAADIVSVKGATRADRQASSDALWAWVDRHGKDYGIGRPYHDRDPPHVGPLDGTEYVSRHPGKRASAEPRRRIVAPAHQAGGAAKRQNTTRSPAPRSDAT